MTGTSSLRLAGFELRRFLRGRLPAAALVVICVIPLLYGALYLYAFWDPYGRLNHVPVALVVEDVEATATDGTKVHAGKDLADELIEREIFDWHVTDEREAEDGLVDGRYQLSLRIPRDFSANLTTGPDADATPKPAQLIVINDDATNYLSGVFSRTVFDEVRTAAAQSAQSGYFDKMLIGFTDLKQETQKAADGANKIDNGATDLHGGAKKVEGGIDASEKGAGKIAGGLGTAANRMDQLASGLVTLKSGSAELARRTRQAADGTRQFATAIGAAADKYEPMLRENAQLIETGANLVARGADVLSKNVHRLDKAADDAVANATKLQNYLDGLPDTTPGIAEARAYAKQLLTAAQQIRSAIDDADLEAWGKRLKDVASTAREIADVAPHLADDIVGARAKMDKLAAALGQIATGAQKISNGNSDAAAGAVAIRGGVFELASGARRLDNGLLELSDGGRQLAKGLGDLRKGTDELASGLSDGADEIPGYGKDPSDRADLLADPVRVDRTVRNPAATYGVGFAPYFLALALWVGAMITFMVLRPLNRRYVVSGAPPHRVVLAGLLPAVAIGFAQALLLFVVVVFGLGLGPHNPAVTLGLLMLTATAFAAIMQLVGAALGPAGRIVALALLMLQLTSSGGTYPVQTTPGFFQAVHPFLPMTYVVAALRHAIDGGSTGTVMTGALALLGYGAAALALTVAVALRKRRLTPSDLHPELVI
ncbi:YhgE/Pip family protein [Couchioplanes caeruleus]|uniref:ABC transporter permease n=2 Tax=Couchioplanes caeruleus TaxID=56438 RepID=A0A1K0FCC5_9ACTN|nr:YhgE/Pip domain-containing protein [Couchioplanes caeruleus]OJF10473.1 ABC transporter permease [Couchioplanes caeruleus subsp. caeruleus]ROP32551.1 putative membrane protein [Couchioplanes caeruleus]